MSMPSVSRFVSILTLITFTLNSAVPFTYASPPTPPAPQAVEQGSTLDTKINMGARGAWAASLVSGLVGVTLGLDLPATMATGAAIGATTGVLADVAAGNQMVARVCDYALDTAFPAIQKTPVVGDLLSIGWRGLSKFLQLRPVNKALNFTGYVTGVVPMISTIKNPNKRHFVLWEQPFQYGPWITVFAISTARYMKGGVESMLNLEGFVDNAIDSWAGYHGSNIFRTGMKLDDRLKAKDNSFLEKARVEFLKWATNVWYSGVAYTVTTAGEKLPRLADPYATLEEKAETAAYVAYAFTWPLFSQLVGNFITVPLLFENFPQKDTLDRIFDRRFQETGENDHWVQARLIDEEKEKQRQSKQVVAENEKEIEEMKRLKAALKHIHDPDFDDQEFKRALDALYIINPSLLISPEERTRIEAIEEAEQRHAEWDRATEAVQPGEVIQELLALRAEMAEREKTARKKDRETTEYLGPLFVLDDGLGSSGLYAYPGDPEARALRKQNDEVAKTRVAPRLKAAKVQRQNAGQAINQAHQQTKKAKINIWWIKFLRKYAQDGQPLERWREAGYNVIKAGTGVVLAIVMTILYFQLRWWVVGFEDVEGPYQQLFQEDWARDLFNELSGTAEGAAFLELTPEMIGDPSSSEFLDVENTLVELVRETTEGTGGGSVDKPGE